MLQYVNSGAGAAQNPGAAALTKTEQIQIRFFALGCLRFSPLHGWGQQHSTGLLLIVAVVIR